MKTNMCTFAIAIAALCWVACDDDDDNVLNKPDLNETDETFVETAAQSNMAEIQFAEVAVTKATDSLVKDFAQQMIEEHTAAQNELEDLSDDFRGVEWPNDLSEANDDIMDQLENAEGYTFDSLYMGKQVIMHEAATSVFETATTNTTETRVKAYASKYLPKLQMHLQRADSIHTAIVNQSTADGTEGTGTNDGTTDGTGTDTGTTGDTGTDDGTTGDTGTSDGTTGDTGTAGGTN